MRTVILAVLFSLPLTVAGAFGQHAVAVSRVAYMSGSDTVDAVLAVPEGTGPFPALVLIHEWWGLNDWIKNNARMFAESGYVALAIDLYRGRVAENADEAHELMRGLPEDRAARDLAAAVRFLKTRADVLPAKIGSIGWCMGGGYSLEAALRNPGLAACVVCYGRLVTDTATVAGLSVPVLGIFGEEDIGIPPKSVNDFTALARGLGKSVDVRIYKAAGHAFMNPNNAKGYRAEAANDAWGRIMKFFNGSMRAR
jgi:carboxymethylenebutenolidase